MSKGKRRQRVQSAKAQRKANIVRSGGTSKYALKRARSTFAPGSPFYFDPSNPAHETVEQARSRERSPR